MPSLTLTRPAVYFRAETMTADHEPRERDDADAIGVLVENHRRFLAFVERRVGAREEAEEILQAAFVKGLEKGASIREGESAVAWFYRVLRNALTDHYRRRASGERALEARARATPEGALDADPDMERVVCACIGDLVGLLKPEYAGIIRRADLEGADMGALARELGITAGNARVRLHRARQALKRELERSCGTCTEHGCLDCTCGTDGHA